MKNSQTSTSQEHRGRGKRFVMTGLGLTLMTIAFLWSWNTFAVDILGQASIEFKHALALQILLLSFVAPFVLVLKLIVFGPKR